MGKDRRKEGREGGKEVRRMGGREGRSDIGRNEGRKIMIYSIDFIDDIMAGQERRRRRRICK